MNMQHANTHENKIPFKLIIIEGRDRGKKIDLQAGREYLVGRAEECDIRIDVSDKTVSRRHAKLNITGSQVRIENLSATNPVLVKGKPVKKTAFKGKDQFRIGESLFAVENTGQPAVAAKTNSPLRIFLIAALVLISSGVLIIIMSGSKPPATPNTEITTSAPEGMPPIQKPLPGNEYAGSGLPATGLTVSSEDMKTADQHFRQGMFFYDTGNISRAVEEWNRALLRYPDHPDAQTWFLRAERELEEKIKTHYQNAMLHYKYMRYGDAAHEFRLVVELSRNKNSDQYINALKLLNEIEGR